MITGLFLSTMLAASLACADENAALRKIGSIFIPWQDYEKLVAQKSVPTLPEMSDRQLAEKLDLTRPNLVEVKKAYDARDDKALEKALSDYLNTIWPPRKIEPTGKPPGNAAQADPYMQSSVEVAGERYELGEHGEKINWWNNFANPDRAIFIQLGEAVWLSEAYAQSGEMKYAQRAIDFVRAFYHNARPPAQREVGWNALGPWSKGSFRFYRNNLPNLYRNIGASPVVTDADRVMLLKMASENGDYYAKVFELPTAHNFLVGAASYTLDLALAFRDFKDQPLWLKRVAEGLDYNIHHAVGEDGAAYERTGYHFAFIGPYREHYRRLKEAGVPLPASFKRTMETMHEWAVWILAPTKQWPQFGHGSMGSKNDYLSFMQGAVDDFPDAKYIRYFATDGKEDEPLNRFARVLIPSGFISMRSDWSEDALYMSVKFNSFLRGSGGHHDAMSFSLWAYGVPWMTNPGTVVGYGELEHDEWDMDTLSHNTVRINYRRHDIADNTGRLENFVSLPANAPGFTYFAAHSDAYASQNADHRRAVLFVRSDPGYWLMYDTVEFPAVPSDFDSYPYDMEWLGHFQPTKLATDPKTKVIVTDDKDGKRLYVLPLDPDRLRIREDKGMIITPVRKNIEFRETGLNPYTDTGPYIRLDKKAAENFGVAFGVVLFPTRNSAPAPTLTSLLVQEHGKPVFDRTAIGARVAHSGGEDILAMAKTPALRKYGDDLTTDGESAYVRVVAGKVVEAGLVRGTFVEYRGTKVVQFAGNAHLGRDGKLTTEGSTAGKLALSRPTFSIDPKLICEILNVPYGHHADVEGKPETGYLGPRRSVVVTWNTETPADALLEYRVRGEKDWLRSFDPEMHTQHRVVLSRMKPGAEYDLRVTCADAEGRMGTLETPLPKKVTERMRP